MKQLLFTIYMLLTIWPLSIKGQNTTVEKSSSFSLGVDFQTKYIWRGMEMMTEDATPIIFPQLSYQNKGWYGYVMGGYSLNGKYAEVDMGLSYTHNWLTIGINDYYYPTIESAQDQYFSFGKNTGHWIEGTISIAPESIPLSLTLSNFFTGADKNSEGKQAYSTYAELGTWIHFQQKDRLALNLGIAFNKSCYNGYEHGLGVSNVELKYTHNMEFKSGWFLPLSVAYVVNPVKEKSFVNLTANFAF